MSRKTTKIIFALIIVAVIIGGGIGVYFYNQKGPIVGRIEFGKKYYLSEIRQTERFAGATMDRSSYFLINYDDNRTGKLYLAGLEATSAAIPFIVTSYKEGVKETVIEFEFIIGNGNDTKIQYMKATSTNNEIRIKAVEKHGVKNIISQNPDDLDYLDYLVTILVFRKEAA